MFALTGVAGKTVQVTIQTDRANNWTTLNPVFAYLDEQPPTTTSARACSVDALLANPDLFYGTDALATSQSNLFKTANGARLPDTRGQKWNFIMQCSADTKKKTFSFQHSFASERGNRVVIAMRPPYTPKLCDTIMQGLQQRWERERQSLQRRPDWEVVNVGVSQAGRKLWLVRIGAPGVSPDTCRIKPCVLFYAREHGDEHDTSWVAQGVINYLLGQEAGARTLRERMLVLVIPLLDPDCAADNEYGRIIRTFHPNMPTQESNAYASFLQKWVNAGHRLDLTINLHNVESKEGPHVFPHQFEAGVDRLAAAMALHAAVRQQLGAAGYTVTTNTAKRGFSPARLGGYVSWHYGTLHQFYEVNSQAPERHLTLLQLQTIGPHLLIAAAKFLDSPDGHTLLSELDLVREWRRKTWARYEGWCRSMGHGRPDMPMMNELAIENAPQSERDFRNWGGPYVNYLTILTNAPYPDISGTTLCGIYKAVARQRGKNKGENR